MIANDESPVQKRLNGTLRNEQPLAIRMAFYNEQSPYPNSQL